LEDGPCGPFPWSLRGPIIVVMPLRDEIAELLRMPENGVGAPSLAAIESTLTDGYAAKLALEAERWRIERRLTEVARSAGKASGRREFARLSAELETADGELATLRSLLRNLQARRRVARRAAA
jgi:hypothetical protein